MPSQNRLSKRQKREQQIIAEQNMLLQAMMKSMSHHKNLKGISHYNSMAVRKVQACLRGYLARLKLWRYGGILMVACVKKIQRVWRGHRGRRKALSFYRQKLTDMANRLIGMFRMWKAKRFRRLLRAEAYNRIATKLQSLFRGRVARAYFRRLREIFRNNMAKKIQKTYRRCIGSQRFRSVKKRLDDYIQHMKSFRKGVIIRASRGLKISLEHVEVRELRKLFNSIMCYLFNTFRTEISVDLSTFMAHMYPSCPLNSFAMQMSLLAAWASYGKQRLVRMRYLQLERQLQ